MLRSWPDGLGSKVAATLFWLLFVVWQLDAEVRGARRTSAVPSQLLISLPECSASTRVLRLIIEQDDHGSMRRETLSTNMAHDKQVIALPASQGGRLAVKAVVLDASGCIVYGGAVETLVEQRPFPRPPIRIALRKLDVPLCS